MDRRKTTIEVSNIQGVQCAACGRVTLCCPVAEYPGRCGHCGDDDEPTSVMELTARVPLDHYGEQAGDWEIVHGYTVEPDDALGAYAEALDESGRSVREDVAINEWIVETARETWLEERRDALAEEAEERRFSRYWGGEDASCESATDRTARLAREREGR